MRLITFLLFLVPGIVFGGHYGGSTVINNYYSVPSVAAAEPASVSGMVGDDDFDMAQAMSAAGDVCVFDYASGWQGCVGAGFFGNAEAYNGSAVTRVDQFMIRVNLQADRDFEEYAVGVGGSWHF